MEIANPRRLRLFHFDIKTYGNYGDTLLFEAVRHLFNGFGGGRYFEVYDSRPLRDPVGPALVSAINEHADAVVIGGGGLFLRDTNPNVRSGWQWNISVEMLRRIEKPLIIFGVGNNRFPGQEDFSAPFAEHVNLTLEKSVFFGLRNTGSVETIRDYIHPENRHRVEFQPCPTTLASYLFPDLWLPELPDERRIGFQMIVGRRQARAGFSADRIYRDVLEVCRQLNRDGWSLESAPHARADLIFAERAEQAQLPLRHIPLFGDPDGLYAGVEYFADLPFFLGTRGHAQMVPFGMGAIPVSLLVHPKTAYFARDIGHPELTVDPRLDGFPNRLYTTLREAEENRVALRKELAGVREDFYSQTLANLAAIYTRITGDPVDPSLHAYTPFERRLAARGYAWSMSRDRADQRVRELTQKLPAPPQSAPPQPTPPEEAERLYLLAKQAAARQDYAGARVLLRAVDALSPDFFTDRPRPRWDAGRLRVVPAPVLSALAQRRRR